MKEKGSKCLSAILALVVSLAVLNAASAPVTLADVYMDPEENARNPGEYFTVDIYVADITGLYSWGIKIGWERDLLKVTDVKEGPFLDVFPGGTAFVKKIYDNYIDIGCTVLGEYPGASGSGILMRVTFKVLDAGRSALDIYYSVLLDKDSVDIPHTVESGYFYTTVEANLVKKSAWPEHHHFDISTQIAKDGDANQTLYGKVKNIGPAGYDLYVYVAFEIVRDNGIIDTPESDVIVVSPGTQFDLTADFGPLDDLDAGKHYVTAICSYSYTGTYWAQGTKIKTFSFAVVP